jgi:hypothetical protein
MVAIKVFVTLAGLGFIMLEILQIIFSILKSVVIAPLIITVLDPLTDSVPVEIY